MALAASGVRPTSTLTPASSPSVTIAERVSSAKIGAVLASILLDELVEMLDERLGEDPPDPKAWANWEESLVRPLRPGASVAFQEWLNRYIKVGVFVCDEPKEET